jgi:hypothetical protein
VGGSAGHGRGPRARGTGPRLRQVLSRAEPGRARRRRRHRLGAGDHTRPGRTPRRHHRPERAGEREHVPRRPPGGRGRLGRREDDAEPSGAADET